MVFILNFVGINNLFSLFKTNVRKCDFECQIHGIINSGKIEGA